MHYASITYSAHLFHDAGHVHLYREVVLYNFCIIAILPYVRINNVDDGDDDSD